MLKKISLSAMMFTYLFAGLAHIARADYYLAFVPLFIPQARWLVLLSGGIQILLAVLLIFPKTRRGACYGILLLWSISLPINFLTVASGGNGTAYNAWQLKTLIPFHLLLMLWVFVHVRMETRKSKPSQDLKLQSLNRG